MTYLLLLLNLLAVPAFAEERACFGVGAPVTDSWTADVVEGAGRLIRLPHTVCLAGTSLSPASYEVSGFLSRARVTEDRMTLRIELDGEGRSATCLPDEPIVRRPREMEGHDPCRLSYGRTTGELGATIDLVPWLGSPAGGEERAEATLRFFFNPPSTGVPCRLKGAEMELAYTSDGYHEEPRHVRIPLSPR
jgi:hypothetical protein